MKQALPFRNLYIGITQILQSVFEQNRYTDKEIERTFKQNKQWGSRDRAFVAETVYDIVRWKSLIDYASNAALKRKDYWSLIATYFIINNVEIPQLEEFGRYNIDKIKSNYLKAKKIPNVWYSVSPNLYKLGVEQLGEESWNQELDAMNQPAPPILRLNTLKANEKMLRKSLAEAEVEIEAIPDYPDAYLLVNQKNLFQTEAFKNGWFEMQDASSQLVAPFLELSPGMRVVDTCAGGGGKSLHMAALLQNKGSVLAMDIVPWKLKEVKKRAKRNAAFNIQTKIIESSKTIKRLHNSFDRVLIDAPCTGVGVLKRNPDAKWKINQDFLQRVTSEQTKILASYPKMLKKGGLMVYATCSIFPAENEKQIQRFLVENPNFELIEEKKILPSQSGFDGFYMAKLVRKD
ncbi:methyltransferase domain-containing protein [Ornithobacterium rhinotracheale]|uniref:RsmB/NOP family class I SAM-dependent RNA methyltransferase n=1 Tax=Ornithobacterium rhinotracheale TaxID=28251 RepID=UPI00129CF6F8|nr:RsmB/NOP family class I SAM-dependent RNA methyltransferase [Ornithobacterium rhinotracheale]MRJ08150.1 methyltransferase domain-containing protein [Ornithobacterium rhinotracheale]UOH77349.1 RsmB/NOP family class I SAM-dependent RNA methyltransferase [Ornithobacterium rhinotracheale]